MSNENSSSQSPPDFIQSEDPDVETSDNLEAQVGTPEGGDGVNQQTGEYGAGVDWDTGADVGDTGTPTIDQKETQQRVDDELNSEQ